MIEEDEALPEIYVLPGELHCVSRPTILRTLLGSCVGITFFAPRLNVGALCHPMLPKCPPHTSGAGNSAANYRYVDFAIREVARILDTLGAKRSEVQVKIFGGGDVLSVASDVSRPTVGNMNCDVALRVLEEEKFMVVASRLRGITGVQIKFETGSGDVWLRELNSSRKLAQTGRARADDLTARRIVQ
jgi:chemotaxis protein CheD